ncbi:MAG: MogA/MoaB family molybdenum cofactor biosynthesis protein [Syntrophales bacterium]|nr:MogA/MoaB family molybdenum cofactor biosynthesis protein [Syntrophales bacterium]
MIKAAIITVSDKGARGERIDLSGPEIARLLGTIGAEIIHTAIIPDEKETIAAEICECADVRGCDLILTTGGTGVSPRDVTPEATLSVIDRTIPGLAEEMRRASATKTPHALLSRALAGIRNKSLIINLPGSPKGARENLEAVLPALPHAIEKIKGDPTDCGEAIS